MGRENRGQRIVDKTIPLLYLVQFPPYHQAAFLHRKEITRTGTKQNFCPLTVQRELINSFLIKSVQVEKRTNDSPSLKEY